MKANYIYVTTKDRIRFRFLENKPFSWISYAWIHKSISYEVKVGEEKLYPFNIHINAETKF